MAVYSALHGFWFYAHCQCWKNDGFSTRVYARGCNVGLSHRFRAISLCHQRGFGQIWQISCLIVRLNAVHFYFNTPPTWSEQSPNVAISDEQYAQRFGSHRRSIDVCTRLCTRQKCGWLRRRYVQETLKVYRTWAFHKNMNHPEFSNIENSGFFYAL